MKIITTFIQVTGITLFIVVSFIVGLLLFVDEYKDYQVDYIDQLPEWQYTN